MPGWTKKNLDGLEDRSPADVPMRWRSCERFDDLWPPDSPGDGGERG